METAEITVERRTATGKGPARRLRGAGKVPAILYGPKRLPTTLAVDAAQLDRRLAHLEGTHLIRLVDAAKSDADFHMRMVLVRELQRHPVSGAPLHVDFYEVDLTERLTVSVMLRFVGKAAGVVAGGIVQPLLRELEVECLPTEIPDYLEVDVSALGVHDALHAGDIPLPPGVSIAGDPGQSIVTVLPPTVEARPEAAEAAAEAGPAAGVPASSEQKKPPGES